MSFKLALAGVIILGLGIGAGIGAWQAQPGNAPAANAVAATSPRPSSVPAGNASPDAAQQAGNRPVTGTVEKVGDKEFSLKPDASSNAVTVRVNDQTSVSKQATGTISDIKKGDRIVAQGGSGSDGVLSATSVQVIPPDGGGLMAQMSGFQANAGARQRQGSPPTGGTDSKDSPRERFAIGQVESVDGNTITISMLGAMAPGGSPGASKEGFSNIVVSDKTTVTKTVSGSLQDLKEGTVVSVTGPRGTDGMIDAASVQILPAGATQTPRK